MLDSWWSATTTIARQAIDVFTFGGLAELTVPVAPLWSIDRLNLAPGGAPVTVTTP